MERENLKKKKNLLIIGIITLVVVLLGSTFAFFMYSKTIQALTLTSNSIKAEFQSGTNSINIAYAYPISDGFAKQNLDKLGYLDFTVKGSVSNKEEGVTYEIYLTEDNNNTLDSNFIKVYLTYDNDAEVVSPSIYNDLKAPTLKSASDGKVILTKTEAGTFESKYRIYAWIYEKYEQNEVNQTFSFKVNIYAYNGVAPKTGSETLKEAIANHTTSSCTPTITDDNGTPNNPSDDTIYFSGDNTCIDFNYVWYSGKLWRITAIYPDGTMKMITQNEITAIPWNANTIYKDSWIYQWLNEDFKDTLYNYANIIVQNANWNTTYDENDPKTKPPTDASATIVNGDVGLLNAYEYYQSYKNINPNDGYLNIGYYWWLLTPQSDLRVDGVVTNGDVAFHLSSSMASGVRPVVNLKANIELNEDGKGTKTNPYTITIDKTPGKPGELISSRLSGEYVNVDNKEYRIVGIENGITKLISVDYLKVGDTLLRKSFGSNTSWVDSVESGDEKEENGEEKYWGAYLNNTWVKTAIPNYKDILEKGTYYFGTVGSTSYKNSICSESNTNKLTRSCAKTSSKWEGLVGLPRVGEMFAAQLGKGESTSSYMWLITPFSNNDLIVRNVNFYGDLGQYSISFLSSVRPCINLKSEIIISSGSGTKEKPYEVTLPNQE